MRANSPIMRLKHVVAEEGRRADADGAELAGGDLARDFVGARHGGADGAAEGGELHAGVGRGERAPAALEQGGADALLHQRDGAAERRLRGAEPLGGNAQRAGIEDGGELDEMARIELHIILI